jgi:hypothetical protein
MRNQHRNNCLLAMIVAAWFPLAAVAFGQENDWINPAGGIYENGANWSAGTPGGYPSTFNLGTSGYTVTMTKSDTDGGPDVENDNPTINLNSQNYYCVNISVGGTGYSNSSLTLLGPGTVVQYADDEVSTSLNVNNGQLIVNGATIDQENSPEAVGVAAGATMTVENGGVVEQPFIGGGDGMTFAGNLMLNDGTVNSLANMTLYGTTTLTNGSTLTTLGLAASGLDQDSFNVFGNVVVDNSTLFPKQGALDFAPGSSLTIKDNGTVYAYNGDVDIDGTVDIVSGRIDGFPLEMDAALTVQLNANMSGPATSPINAGGLSIAGGSLDVTARAPFLSQLGRIVSRPKFMQII